MSSMTPREEEKIDVDEEIESERRRQGAVSMSNDQFVDEGDAGGETAPKKENKLFQDYKKTGSWGKVNKTDLFILGGLAALILIAGIVVLVVWLATPESSGDKESKAQNNPNEQAFDITYTGNSPSPASSSASPFYIDPSTQLNDTLQLIGEVTDPDGNPIVDISTLVNQNVLFFNGKFDSVSASTVERGISWLLLQDPGAVGENWLLPRLALVCLYIRLGGDEWINQKNWLSEKTVCEWDGVICDRQNSKVEELNLKENNLIGSIPLEISLLTDLSSLNLKDNQLSGTIPAIALGSLPNLASIYLSRNKLTGGIEEALRNNGVLTTLHVDGNSLVGEWPTTWDDGNGKSLFNLPSSISADCGDGIKNGLDLSRCQCDIHMFCHTCTEKYCVLVFSGI
mmetsp:Transcript_18890/g.27942  ORF Transcript_18890/g.27942 Transcript_18890/m.27942 type:complete len:398 (-) Transcript_18890:51-1244(-)